jgi:hypothetical protein
MTVRHGNRFVCRLLLDEEHFNILERQAKLVRRRASDLARVIVEEHLEQLESQSTQSAS